MKSASSKKPSPNTSVRTSLIFCRIWTYSLSSVTLHSYCNLLSNRIFDWYTPVCSFFYVLLHAFFKHCKFLDEARLLLSHREKMTSKFSWMLLYDKSWKYPNTFVPKLVGGHAKSLLSIFFWIESHYFSNFLAFDRKLTETWRMQCCYFPVCSARRVDVESTLEMRRDVEPKLSTSKQRLNSDVFSTYFYITTLLG